MSRPRPALSRLGDLALRLTTRRPLPHDLEETGLSPLLAPWQAKGWQARIAAPSWHGIWARDLPRLAATRTILLADPAGDLGQEEHMALLLEQLFSLGLVADRPERLSAPLSSARRKLAQRLARLD